MSLRYRLGTYLGMHLRRNKAHRRMVVVTMVVVVATARLTTSVCLEMAHLVVALTVLLVASLTGTVTEAMGAQTVLHLLGLARDLQVAIVATATTRTGNSSR